jgi:hypothetical protein
MDKSKRECSDIKNTNDDFGEDIHYLIQTKNKLSRCF